MRLFDGRVLEMKANLFFLLKKFSTVERGIIPMRVVIVDREDSTL
jgi:hypothetical protein